MLNTGHLEIGAKVTTNAYYAIKPLTGVIVDKEFYAPELLQDHYSEESKAVYYTRFRWLVKPDQVIPDSFNGVMAFWSDELTVSE